MSPIAEFGFKPRVSTDSDPASPKRAPHASASRRDAAAAAAVDFEVRENARLALELKQEELVKLRRRLSATEEALREGAERNAELETRLSEHEGRAVEAEAEALNSSLAAAMRDVRGFFSAGGKVDAAKKTDDHSHKDARGNDARAFANGQSHDHGVLRSGLKKSASKSRASRDGGSTDANERRGVTFVAESEQKRLEEEGGYVAKLRVKTAENEDLVARLLASETSLERKREQMRVAKASYEALQKRLEEETRRREAAERALDDSAKSRVAVSDGPNEHATEATKTKHLLRDVLALTAHACGVTGRADSRAITAALPALAALARAGPGESARELLTETRVLEHITDAFETHEDDAAVAASVCATLAALVAGARAAGGRDEFSKVTGVFQSNALAARSGARLARVVSRALAKHRSSPEACACACDLMRALASERDDVSETLTSELVRLGSASGAVGAAEWHPSDEDVVLAAARALVSMVEHGTARDARSMARCGAAGVVRRAERHGLDTGLRRAGRAVESWARENAENAENAADADEETKDENAAAPRTTPRRRAAIPEEAAYEGSGFKPRVASQSWRERGRRDANGDADAAYGNGGDRTDPADPADVSEDDFDDAQFDDKL